MPDNAHFFSVDPIQVMEEIGHKRLIQHLKEMVLIRHFETFGEVAYQQGKVGGFYHSSIGQEAISVGCVAAASNQHWYTSIYRCHGLALILGVSPESLMAELYGKVTGNVMGRGGSMHLFSDHLLGGLAIVGGHVPIATGAAFSIKYLKEKGRVSFCFLGEGAVAQGAVHESINLASLWQLPCIYVIENNRYGMGTSVSRAIAFQPIAEKWGRCFDIPGYTVDGMDFLQCYALFQHVVKEALAGEKPILIEAMTERFRGHSISDPGLYRTKEELAQAMRRDPISRLKTALMESKHLSNEEWDAIDREAIEKVRLAMDFADQSPWPDPILLEEGVLSKR